MADAVILIPGFFGFGRFGTPPGNTIEYFNGVRDELCLAERSLVGRVVVHEPPPTGSLDERVASLHDAVRNVLAGIALPHNPRVRADVIHLVGHSAGGVDARLYANSGFSWAGGPRDAERSVGLDAIGHVVTVSSPHFGTPIADAAVFERDALLFAIYLRSVLGMSRFKLPAAATLLVGGAIGAVARHLPHGTPLEALLRVTAGLDGEAAPEVQRFFSKLLQDRQLMNDLTVRSLGERSAALRATDHPDLHCYVSVSPPPRAGLDFPLERLLYRKAHGATAGSATPGTLPQGPVIGGHVIERLRESQPSDGVVPVVSQTVDGHATGIVEADHLDVVGHYAGGTGVTVFKSSAGFEAARMRALWTHVASVLATGPSTTTTFRTTPDVRVSPVPS